MYGYDRHTENDLMQLVAGDDERAFAELYERVYSVMYAVAFARFNDEQTCEDVMHDVFASVWANRKKIIPAEIKSYLIVAVKYAVLEKIRKKNRQQTLENSGLPQSQMNNGPVEILEYKAIEKMMHEAIEKLPEKCRQIFRYRREEDMPIAEIAGKLGISPNTVKVQLRKAFALLKKGIQYLLA